MGAKSGEKILVVTDIPTTQEFIEKGSNSLYEALKRSLLAKIVSEIATENLKGCAVECYPYSSTGRHGVEPGKDVAEKMKSSDVTVAITTYSLTHTDARTNACSSGTRVASMPTFLAEMFYPAGPMAADYKIIAKETEMLANELTKANVAHIKSEGGTDLTCSLRGRKGGADHGIFTEKGAWGNLPSGEAYIAPLEGTAQGKIVVELGWYPDLRENITFEFKEGNVLKIIGGGDIGRKFEELLSINKDEEAYMARRNLAELGIGTNPNAKRPDNLLESEKIRGTVHLAIGDNAHMGGKVTSDLHQDFVIPKPDLYLDEKLIMKKGEIVIK